MLARPERYLYALIAMLALWAVVVAVTPVTAQAQEETAPTKNTKDTNNPNTAGRSIVVSPGDCLWSITSERLGPRATPQQIAIGVERIYALNQNRIGSDPNLIFVGQKLSLPPMDEEPSRRARGAAEAAEASTRGPDREKALEASRTSRNTETKPVALPEVPSRQPVPEVGAPSATEASSPVESFVRTARSLLSSATSAIVGLFPQADRLEERKLLGLGIIALTLLVAGFIAWKMPLKRNVGGYEVWGIPTGYAGGYMYPTEATDHYGGTPRLAPTSPVSEPDSGSVGGDASAVESGPNGAGMIVAARRRRHQVLREQERGYGHSPLMGLATGAHDPQVTRHLRRARSSALGRIVAGSPQHLRWRTLYRKGGRL